MNDGQDDLVGMARVARRALCTRWSEIIIHCLHSSSILLLSSSFFSRWLFDLVLFLLHLSVVIAASLQDYVIVNVVNVVILCSVFGAW